MKAVPSIYAVLVLYKMELAESPAFQSLAQLLAENPTGQDALTLMVCDNTPDAIHPAPIFPGEYHHDPSNPGLAKSYNRALASAVQQGDKWLMLLDQDTRLTGAYLVEALRLIQQFDKDEDVVSIVPKLVEKGIVQSPHHDLTTVRPTPLPRDYSGFPSELVHVYNSGALIRTAALRRIGGFPERFWLDFLDHATFHLLRQHGEKVYVMQAELQHALSTNAAIRGWNGAYLARHRNVLDAEFNFYRCYGTAQQKRWYKLRLLRLAYGALKHLRLPMVWQLLRTLVRVQ